MKHLAILYVLSSGLITIPTSDATMCFDTLLEAKLIFGKDLWSAVCTGDGETYVSLDTMGIGP